jgi:CMP-N-acetylneuraminic acid synthetase
MRPSLLASDEAPMLPVLKHAVEEMRGDGFNPDVVVLLQPTSPLRRAEHIDAAIDWLQRTRGDSVVSVVEVPHQFNPTSVMQLDDGLLKPFLDAPTITRRQDKPRLYARNGPAVLAVHARVIDGGSLYGNESWPLIMTPEESLDIDTPSDLRLAEAIITARSNAHSV